MEGTIAEYRSPRHVQILFLKKSRRKLRIKYRELKVDEKRLQNRVRDVTKSREQWRSEAEELAARLAEAQRENAALQQQVEVLKKRAVFLGGADH